jgi:hypothetical protein
LLTFIVLKSKISAQKLSATANGRAGTRAHLQTAKGDSFTVHALFRRFSLEMILA